MAVMSKLLNGRDLADYIKERQGRQVRALVQANGITPKLAIVVTDENPVIEVYMRLKTQYGTDLGAEVEIHRVKQPDTSALINKLNKDKTVQAIIVQLPLADPAETDKIVNLIEPAKDVDGLGDKVTKFDPATPMAILWLLAGYNIELKGKHILLIGRGKLVGAPLQKMLSQSGMDVEMIGRVDDLKAITLKADIIVTATGSAGLLKPDMIKLNAVVVDAGVASEAGKTVGDLAPEVYDRADLTLTPVRGGVGPLTVCALFENVIKAAQPS
jgi:methylenetetrahydrofolate dehydrogenase (NADP+)/methenyltetrahydrofolate cyclohydrolase